MGIRTRRLVISLPVAVLLTAALATAAAAESSAHASSSPRSLPTWAHGSITGAGPHSGVRLVLLAWPSQSVLARTRVGQRVHTQVIATATSSSTGSYSLRPKVTLSRGIHNLQILARSSSAVGTFSFARRITRSGAASVAGSASSRSVAVNIRMRALPKSAMPAVPHLPICITVRKTHEYGQKLVNVGGLYSLLFPAKMNMTYTAGATTSIEAAASYEGDFGSFSAGGTFTETASSKVHFPPETDETTDNMQTNFTFGRYSVCGLLHEVLPEKFAGGDNEVSLFPPGATHCTHYNSNGGLTRTTGTAGTFKVGVSFKKEIGIDLSAQSGYSKSLSTTWTFPAGGYLCGSNDVDTLARWDVMDPTSSGNPGQLKGGRSSR